MSGRPTAITRPFINPIDMKRSIILLACTTLFCGCGTPNRSAFTGARGEAELIVLHPADEHLAQVQSRMNPQINRTVHVFAPEGEGLQSYLARINTFNSRPDSATSWNEVVSNEGDFLARMLGEKPGNVALLSGRTATAAGYSAACIGAGLNVLSTAPLASGTPGTFWIGTGCRLMQTPPQYRQGSCGRFPHPSASSQWKHRRCSQRLSAAWQVLCVPGAEQWVPAPAR